MTRSIGAQLALFSFAMALLAGLYVGNSPTTVLLRAMVILVIALLVGQTIALTAKWVLRDHLQRTKLAIDQEHQRKTEALEAEAAEDVSQTSTTLETGT
ncbi:MAG: hypothetical protein IH986_08275 [Planctomycetes bacterium]|nr:hypothetical protein [Planctomycetota bacterium]